MAPPFQLKIHASRRIAQKKRVRPVFDFPHKIANPKNRRQQMKEKDPVKYESVRRSDMLRSRLYRLEMTDDEKRHSNRLAAIRQRRYRKRQKEKAEAARKEAARNKVEHGQKRITRSEKEKRELKKKKAAEKKRQQRANWSAQKKEAVKAKRRAAYKAKKEQEGVIEENKTLESANCSTCHANNSDGLSTVDPPACESPSLPTCTESDTAHSLSVQQVDYCGNGEAPSLASTRRKRLSRIRKYLPSDPRKYVELLKDIQHTCTLSPSKSAALEKVGFKLQEHDTKQRSLERELVKIVEEEVKNTSTRTCRKKRGGTTLASSLNVLKTSRLQRYASKRLKINRKQIVSRMKKRAGRPSIPSKTVTAVKKFFERNANPLPLKKLVSSKTNQPKMVLTNSISNLYKQFCGENPNIKLCCAKFFQLKPKNISSAQKATYRGCLCETCENIRLKIVSLDRRLDSDGHRELKLTNATTTLSMTLCPKTEFASFHQVPCIKRTCKDCGTAKLDDHLHQVSEQERSQQITWRKWELTSGPISVRKKKMVTKRRQLLQRNGTLQDLINELKAEIDVYAVHVFNWHWQALQYSHLKGNLPEKWVLNVWDFAENYTCYYQDEIQSAYWSRNQVTVHPVVNFYNCESEDCDQQVCESIVFISDDNEHDHNAVNTYMKLVSVHLTQKRNIDVAKMVRFSDNCAAQYKSKGPISDIAHASVDYSFPLSHNYFGSRHGKSASDGESAVVKSHATRAVNSGLAVIANGRDLYEYCVQHLEKDKAEGEECTHFRRSFYYIGAEEVQRQREWRGINTVKGTRSLHSIMSTDNVNIIMTRELSCFCMACQEGKEIHVCSNAEFVGSWKMQPLTTLVKEASTVPVETRHGGEKDEITSQDQDVEGDHAHLHVHELDEGGQSDGGAKQQENSEMNKFGTHTNPQHAEITNTLLDGSGGADQLSQNDFVAVRVPVAGKKNQEHQLFIATIDSVQAQNYRLMYLLKTGNNHLYTWPEGKAVATYVHPPSDIICRLEPPVTIVKGTRLYMQFDLHTAEKLFTSSVEP